MARNRKAIPFPTTPLRVQRCFFPPTGKRTTEIYMQALDATIHYVLRENAFYHTTEGPRNGKELYYMGSDGRVYAGARVRLSDWWRGLRRRS